MYVIGTAGHVDHGKSTLVEALTGIDPDRLAEEKEREMTIELGFAWLTLPASDDDEPLEVGIVDVPGHRDFIENMLAGVGGIDVALLVVAADEGVMPQTREHLAILDLLQIDSGIVALTKTDLVSDPDWLELVTLDVSEALVGTTLADAPVLPVSARTGAGMEALKEQIRAQLAATPQRVDEGRPRLPIDRVFTLPGFGTIVTGTLVGGSLRVGDAIEVHPVGKKGRVRGLQTHKRARDVARPGSRVAVNLTGIDRDDIQRGHVLARPGVVTDSILVDASYRHLPDADRPLKHNMEVKLFLGAAEIMGRTRVLGSKSIAPGESGWLQLALSAPAAVARGDRFILRLPSPGITLGGGNVLDPSPGRRHRRFRADVIGHLETLAQGTPGDLLLQALRREEPATPAAVQARAGLDESEARVAWDDLVARRDIILIGQLAISRTGWERLSDRAHELVARYHDQNPLRLGMPREELRSRLRLASGPFGGLMDAMQAAGTLTANDGIVRAPDHAVRFSDRQEKAIEGLTRLFAAQGINSPSVKESKALVGEDVYAALVDLGRLRQLNLDVVYATPDYERFRGRLLNLLEKQGRTTAAEVRDVLDTSRKYAIAWLEHLDELRVTRRVGDERQLVNPAAVRD
jgi:selenocysteine-specific elongation factor